MNVLKNILLLVQTMGIITIDAQIQTFAPTVGTYASFDLSIKNFMQQSGLTKDVVATLAISTGGKVLYKQAYAGDLLLNAKPTPDLVMRIASCTKPFTEAAIKQLANNKKFALDDPFYNFLTTGNNAISLLLPGKALQDPQIAKVRIVDLLDHTGGWDIKILGWDPMFKMTTIAQEYKTINRPTPQQVITWMLSNYPLQHQLPAPYAYSNFGYCILGRVIEKASGKQYVDYIKTDLMRNSMPTLDLAHSKNRNQNEVQWYLNDNNSLSHYTLDCNDQIIGYWVESLDAHGGLLSSAPDLCTFMSQFWINGDQRSLSTKGYTYYFWGSLPSTLAIMYQHPSGIDVAFLMNTRPANPDAALQNLTNALGTLIQSLPPAIING